MGFLIITLIVLAVLASIFIKATVYGKTDTHQQQPMHFDLLDNNGDPVSQRQSACDPKVRQLRYFCIKDKGYHVSVWPKNNRIGENIEFGIAGMSFRESIDDYLGEHSGTLEAEPTNPYDATAIKILAEDGHHVGYVPKDMTDEVRKHTSLPCKCYFYIGENDDTYFSDCYIKIYEYDE